MSISRIQAIETGNNVPKVDIDSTKNNIPKVPVDLQGGAPVEPVIESLSITENGTYTPEEGVDGFAPVVVDVETPLPTLTSLSVIENGTYTPEQGVDGFNEVNVNVSSMPISNVISEFDFTSNTPYFDMARQIDSTTWFSGLTLDSGVGLRITSYTTQSRTPTYLNFGQYYHIELGIGNLDNDSYIANTYDTNALFGMMLNSGAIELFFEKSTSKWAIKSTATKVYLDDTIYNTPTHFDGKKIDIYYGCYLNNGVLTKHENYCHVYFEGVELGNALIVGNTNDYIPNCRLGGRKYPIYAMVGARFTSLKTEQIYSFN